MDIDSFLRKQADIAQTHGPLTAARTGLQEAALKVGAPLARWKATPIWAGEWDVCLVLDACRYDLWQEVLIDWDYKLGPSTKARWSVGSHSVEWLEYTFNPRYAKYVSDSAYVTANPNAERTENCDFGYYDPVYQDAWPMSDELRTVDPETLTKRGLYAHKEASTQQTIVHYMQPHVPFAKRPEWSQGRDLTGDGTSQASYVWPQVRDGEIPKDEAWDAYAANLEWVLRCVKTWIETTQARILITSDHGNAIGEYGQWGHPPESANPAIRRVPWVITNGIGDGIPDAMLEAPPQDEQPSQIEEQLAALGYV